MSDPAPSDADAAGLARAVELAGEARRRGDHPFGALVVTPSGRSVPGLNAVVTASDPTGHAETVAIRAAAAELGVVELAAATLYASTEPCPMCAGAVYWSGVGRVVYAVGEDELIAMVREQDGIPTLALGCREVFARGGRAVEVVGPVETPGAREVHRGFWS